MVKVFRLSVIVRGLYLAEMAMTFRIAEIAKAFHAAEIAKAFRLAETDTIANSQ